MQLDQLMLLQNACLAGALLVATVWEALRPYQAFAGGRERLAHVARNIAFGAISIVMVSILIGNAGLHFMRWGESAGVGVLSMLALPLWVLIPVGFVLADLSDYFFHRLCHEWRILWLMHSVHHSDLKLDVSTTIRTHPGQSLAAVAWRILVAFALGIPLWIVVLRDISAIGVTVLAHANVCLPERIDARFRSVFVTPAMHKLHHSPLASETNANYGGLFSLWDRLFGTYVEPHSDAKPIYGLQRLRDARDQSVLGMLLTPWRARRYETL